ncbi:DUF4175 family protein [Rhodobacter sp. NTK016B]|nr:DUF4175 family protein [Rhodobacter sp. NTK016B]MBN8290873.1 DUF4175 family protein [Rhodobacter sp. NTK016B]
MLAERVARALWLPVSLALIAATLWAFDLHTHLPGDAALWVAGGFALAIVISLGMGLWRFRWPRRAEAVARLDRTLAGRPLAALTDQQAINASDPASAAIWQAHRARMAAAAARARAVRPKPDLARRDPYALRLVALTAAAMALLFAVPGQQGPLAGMPGAAGAAIGPSWEGWIMPPSYTDRPGLYLNEIERDSFEVPQGSRVVLRFYGAPGALTLEQSLDDGVRSDESGQALEFDARRAGRIEIDGPNGRAWDVAVAADALPQITADGAMTRARGGVAEQAFTATDDYGVQTGEAIITLDMAALDRRYGLAVDPEPRDPLRLALPMPMSGARDTVTETLREDLSLHPWANMPVRVVLSATDAAGQTGESPASATLLPGRRFFEPSAQALIEIRRDLLWSRENAHRSAMLMRAMLYRSDNAFLFRGAPSMIRGAVAFIETRLEDDSFTPEARDELAQDLWDLALLIEEGELANARERLQRARDRLDEAMERGADPSEIQDLMDELREATRDYMEMLAEQMPDAEPEQGDQRDMGEDGENQTVTQSQIQEMMDRIQELMEEGRMDEAAELMAQLNALLDNLQMTRGEGGESMPGGEAMEGLGDTLGDQQSLADETFEQLQEQFGENGQDGQQQSGEGEPNGEDGQQGEIGKDTEQALQDLAERQRALRERLRDQQLEDLPGDGTAEGENGLTALEEANRAMERAAEALEQGDMRGALQRQAEALDALREGLREFRDAQTADRREQQGSDGDQMVEGQGTGRDPLGRELGSEGQQGETGSTLPGENPRARARELMDEIRRRLAERERSDDERDYLDRLIESY